MLQGYHPVTQALLGTLFTWGLTALGASVVIFVRGNQRKLLDVSLGFSAGVMMAASYWSLLSPAIDQATESKLYGDEGQWVFLPVAAGFFLGSFFVYGTDLFIDYLGINTTNIMLAMTKTKNHASKTDDDMYLEQINKDRDEIEHFHSVSVIPATDDNGIESFSDCITNQHVSNRKRPGRGSKSSQHSEQVYHNTNDEDTEQALEERRSRWKRIMLLVVAITIHNIPEGLAVGVGFGAAATSNTTTFESARNLAIGIGIQNFPEGLAVSLPLQATGFSLWRSFWYGQLSGMVEPVFGVLGAVAVSIAQPILPYALAFAAGAMIYVVVDDIIPEANTSGNGKLATWGCVVGFLVMMCLDVGLG